MKRLAVFLLTILLLAGCAKPAAEPETTVPETTLAETTVPTTEAAPTTEPTTEPTTVPTEPPEEHFLLTFTGDCTLGSLPSLFTVDQCFVPTVGEDYGYCFRNFAEVFAADDLTMINLESVFANQGVPAE